MSSEVSELQPVEGRARTAKDLIIDGVTEGHEAITLKGHVMRVTLHATFGGKELFVGLALVTVFLVVVRFAGLRVTCAFNELGG